MLALTSCGTPTDPFDKLMDQSAVVIQKRLDTLGIANTVARVSDDQITVIGFTDATNLINTVAKTGQLDFRAVYVATQAGRSVSQNNNTLPTAPPQTRPTTPDSNPKTTDELIHWEPSSQDIADFNRWSCDTAQDGKLPNGRTTGLPDGTPVYTDGTPIVPVWDQPLFACDALGTVKYLLGPAVVQGTNIARAKAAPPPGQTAHQVELTLDQTGASSMTDLTTTLCLQPSPLNLLAFVFDGVVISAPAVNEPITNSVQITSSFTATEAQHLAALVNSGPLPVSFEVLDVALIEKSGEEDHTTVVLKARQS